MPYGYVVAGSSLIIITTFWGAYYSFGIFFTPLLAEFGWGRAELSGAFSLSFLMFGLLGIISGRLTDKYGPRKVMTFHSLLLGLGFYLMSHVNSVWQIYLFLGVIIGVAISGSIVPLTSTIARWFTARRGLMMAILVTGIGLGTLIIPPLSSQLVTHYGWRQSYVIVGIAAGVITLLASQVLRREPGMPAKSITTEGKPKEAIPSLQTTGFTTREAIRTRHFWIIFFMLASFGFYMQTIMVHIAPYALGQGFLQDDAARFLAIVGGVSILGRLTMGILSDRVGNRKGFITVFLLMAVALFCLTFFKQSYMLYLFVVLFGFGYGGESPLRPLIIAEQFGLKTHGELHGIILCGVAIGGALGPAVVGRTFDLTGSYQGGLLTSAILATISLVLAYILPRKAIKLPIK